MSLYEVMYYLNLPLYKALSRTLHSHNMVVLTLSEHN